MTDLSEQVFNLSCRTDDAYMYDTYGEERWCENIANLLGAGYTEEAVERIVRSKMARWANDLEISILEYINRHVGEVQLRQWMRNEFDA